MRKRLIPLVVAALCSGLATASRCERRILPKTQDKPLQERHASPASESQTPADSTDQPMSLADMARAARAKKQKPTQDGDQDFQAPGRRQHAAGRLRC